MKTLPAVMRRLIVPSAALAIAIGLSAPAPVSMAAAADAAHGQVTFIATQSEAPLEGAFHRFSAHIDFDPDHPQAARIEVEIDVASVDAGGDDADNLLKSREFFDAARFPGATFVATSITPASDGKFQARGQFTLKGHSAPIVIPFAARRDGTSLWLEGGTAISRLAYNVGEGQWSDPSLLEDPVRIKFTLRVASGAGGWSR